MTAKRNSHANQGQALVEFALSLPILLFFIIGIINFGIILFSYSHASNQLRSALRYSEILGYYTDETALHPYLDCAKMEEIAESAWFSSNQVATISYEKASPPFTTYYCSSSTYETLKANVASGDVLHIDLTAHVKLLFFPIESLELNFTGERSIMLSVDVDPVTP